MGYDLLFQQAVHLQEAGELKQAEDLYRQILETAPNNADVLNLMGLIAQAKGLHNQACEWFYKAVKQAPNAAPFYFNLGFSLYNDNKPYEAIDAFQKSLVLAPEVKETHNYLAEVYRSLGDKDKAIHHYNAALKLAPDYTEAQINLCFMTADTAKLEQIVSACPDNAMAVYYLSLLYRNQNRNEEAFNLLQAHDMEVFDLKLALGELALQLAPEHAENYFQSALRLNPDSPHALINLGNFAVNHQNLTTAEHYYKRAIELSPDEPSAHLGYADMLCRAGRRAEALEEYRAATLLNPDSPELSNNLGVMLKETGDYTEALGLFFNAFTRAPQTDEYALNIAETLTLLYYKDPDTAKKIAANWHLQAPNNIFAARINAAFRGELSDNNQIYTQKLFDNFADNYELVLANIGYELPRRFRGITGDVEGLIVDIGCGSGLVGVAYQTDFTHLIGVDISEKMLAKAAEKHCYERLICQDALEFCVQKLPTLRPQLITAADVCCYLNDLTPLLRACAPCPIIFSIENAPAEVAQAKLSASGRYQHNPWFVTELLSSLYATVQSQTLTLRQENGKPVTGTVFYAQ